MVLDKGIGLETAESLMNIAGDYVDYVKFGWGTVVVQDREIVKQKIQMYKDHDITPFTGGTLFELAYNSGKMDDFYSEAYDLGFRTIEISDGSMRVPREDKLKAITMARQARFEVLSEVGKKDPELDAEFTVQDRIDYINAEINAGSSYVIIEAREGGKNIGIYDANGKAKEDEINQILDNVPAEKIIWEAPNKDQQVYFVLKLGNEVNLGNISTDDIISLETIRQGLRGDTFGKI